MKSTVVLDRLAFLLVDVLVDHLIGDRARGDRKVAARPEVPTPELALEVRELLKEKARAGALEPLHDLADVLVRAVAEEQVHVIRGDLARDDLEIVLGRDLPQKVTSPDRDRARQHPLAVLGDPDEVNLEIVTRVAARAVSSHGATSPIFPFA